MTRKLIPVLLFIMLLMKTSAQDFNKSKMDSFFTMLATKNKAMGSIAISKNGNLLYSNVIGYASVNGNDKTASTTETRYRIGSISKMFTAVIIFQLIEENKLSFNDKLSGFFPTVTNADKISIANMLRHRSGLHNFTDDSLFVTYFEQPKSQAEMLNIISAMPSDFEPGTKTIYSNTNFVLLGYIAEKITGNPLSTLVKERITKKLNLNDTYVGGKTNQKNKECQSFMMIHDWSRLPETDLSVPAGAGSIVSTPADLLTFIEALFNGKLVSATSLDSMKTIKDGLGMGMFRMPFYDHRAYGHNGRIDGFESMLAYFPKDSVAVSYCSNGISYPTNDIMIGVLSIYFNKDFIIPGFEVVKTDSSDLDQYTGDYSSEDIPLKITVSIENNGLVAQATGQSSFPLEAYKKNIFRFEPAGILMEFNPEKKTFTLNQRGQSYLYTKDK